MNIHNNIIFNGNKLTLLYRLQFWRIIFCNGVKVCPELYNASLLCKRDEVLKKFDGL